MVCVLRQCMQQLARRRAFVRVVREHPRHQGGHILLQELWEAEIRPTAALARVAHGAQRLDLHNPFHGCGELCAHFKQHDAQRVDIHLLVVACSAAAGGQRLRAAVQPCADAAGEVGARHPARRDHDGAAVPAVRVGQRQQRHIGRRARPRHKGCKAKVTDLELPVARNEDVVGLEVAMDDARAVDVREALAQLAEVPPHAAAGVHLAEERTGVQRGTEGALAILHLDEQVPVQQTGGFLSKGKSIRTGQAKARDLHTETGLAHKGRHSHTQGTLVRCAKVLPVDKCPEALVAGQLGRFGVSRVDSGASAIQPRALREVLRVCVWI
mmetsp:Transcript_23490/g.58798  ORF Transcript_23490/g.58798 Transcript_23490/m.58798 type:complete len:326 (-) Transcript_23490:264-1241(-)